MALGDGISGHGLELVILGAFSNLYDSVFVSIVGFKKEGVKKTQFAKTEIFIKRNFTELSTILRQH